MVLKNITIIVLMNSPDRKNMDRYYKDQIEVNFSNELKTFEDIIEMLVCTVATKHVHDCKSSEDYFNIMLNHWECFSELMPPFREVKWNLMRITKFRNLAEKKGYGKNKLTGEELKLRHNCIASMLWFGDVLAYSAGLIKEDLKMKRLFGFDD